MPSGHTVAGHLNRPTRRLATVGWNASIYRADADDYPDIAMASAHHETAIVAELPGLIGLALRSVQLAVCEGLHRLGGFSGRLSGHHDRLLGGDQFGDLGHRHPGVEHGLDAACALRVGQM